MARAIIAAALLAAASARAGAAPSALADPARAERIIRGMAGPEGCVPEAGGLLCRVRFADGVTRRVRMATAYEWGVSVWFDRRERAQAAFRAALADFLRALDVAPVEDAVRIAVDGGAAGRDLNIAASAACVHDPDLPENRNASAFLLTRPGGTLCSLRMSHRSR